MSNKKNRKKNFSIKSIGGKIYLIISMFIFLSLVLVLVSSYVIHIENLIVSLTGSEREWLDIKLSGFRYFNKYLSTMDEYDYNMAKEYLEKGYDIDRIGPVVSAVSKGEKVDKKQAAIMVDNALESSSYKSSVDFINLITLMGFLPHVKTLMSEWVGALGDSNEYMPYLDQYHESKDPASLEKMFEFQDVFKVRGDVYSGTLKKLAIFANSLINIALWGLFVLTTGIVIIIALVITRSITKPLKIITHTANEIAKGDLSITEFDISNRDEIGILANTFNDMIYSLKLKADLLERIADGDLSININLTSEADLLGMSLIKMKDSLNRTLGQVVSTVDQVASGTEEIAASSQSLSKGAFEQASAIEQIATLLNEINKRANDNADSALKANNIAIKAKQYAETGNSQMEDLVKAMSDISISSDNIKKIVKTIDDIAFQINLLSINANIEAARAGKYGRGFAVVADEVRELANRSAESVKETNILVEQSLENIVEGNKFVKTTAHQLLEIVNGSSQVEKLVAEIVSVSNNQSKGLLEITKGIDQIDTVTQSNSSSAEESAASCEQLSSQAQLLKTMVSDFKLEVIERQRIKQQF